MIRLEGLRKVFRTRRGDVTALDDVDLIVDKGQYIAVRGPSGCGKSTLLSMVGGLALPTAGRALVAERPISEMTAAQRAQFRAENVGFVFQMFHLLPYLSVLDNILIAAQPGQRKAMRGRAEELLERFQLNDRETHRPGQLSVGQRQRVAMARALLNQPQLLLADEPTGNLDPETSNQVFAVLLDLVRETGLAALIATHNTGLAARMDRILRMDAGIVRPG